MINPSFKFNRVFGLKLLDRLDGTFLSWLIITTFGSMLSIGVVANLDYSGIHKKMDKVIFDRYKKIVSKLIMTNIDTPPQTQSSLGEYTEVPPRMSAAEKNKKQRIQATRAAQKYISKSSGRKKFDPYAGLPDVDAYAVGEEDALDELSHPVANWPSKKGMAGDDGDINNYDAGTLDNPLRHPFNYVIHRKGEMYIDLTEELVNEPKAARGYRDPEEIERVVSKYQPMIEHCFRKEARFDAGLKGYVKISFKISYAGYVIPESIRILNSSLRNKKVEQCIKNYVRHWRSFARLDESMGITRVVQKFIFN